MKIEQTPDEVAESMKDHPQLWADTYLNMMESHQTTTELLEQTYLKYKNIKQNNFILCVINLILIILLLSLLLL